MLKQKEENGKCTNYIKQLSDKEISFVLGIHKNSVSKAPYSIGVFGSM